MGTPAFKCNTFAGKLSVPNEIEDKYNLCYSFQPKDFQKMMLKLKTTLKDPSSKENGINQKIWEDKIDVSEFIYNYIQQFKLLWKGLTIQTHVKLLDALHNSGYTFQRFDEFLLRPNSRVVVLRHDVDKKPENSLTTKLQSDKGLKESITSEPRNVAGMIKSFKK